MRVTITIDGFDGGGKSMLARRLADALGPRAAVLHVDDFRLPVDWARADRSPLELHYEERYDMAALDRCIAAFEAGADHCEVPRFHGPSETQQDPVACSYAAVDHLIVEGVFVRRAARAAGALSLWIDVDQAEARRRMLARDGRSGRSPEEVLSRIETRYLPAHRRYLEEHQPRERATLIIDNTDPAAPRRMRGAAGEDERWAIAWRALESLLA